MPLTQVSRAAGVAAPAALAVAAAVWVVLVTPAAGGAHAYETAYGVVALGAAAVTAARLVPRAAMITATLAGALVVVAAVTAPGWAGTDTAAGKVAAGLAFLAVAGVVRSSTRVRATVAGLLVALLAEFGQAWFDWWGGGSDPNRVMVGTFFWHNQLGVYMAALGTIASAAAVLHHRWWRMAGLFLAPAAYAELVLSTSRTSAALGVLGWASIAVLAFRSDLPRFALARWLAVPALTAALLVVMTSGAFFPGKHWAGPAFFHSHAATTSVAADRGTASLGENGSDRARWTVAALQATGDSPLVGDGFGSFGVVSENYLAPSAVRSALVHDEYAEALESGGMMWGIPLIVGALALGFVSMRAFLRACRRPTPDRILGAGCGAAALILLLHAGVDFDGLYPSLQVVTGAAAAVAYVTTSPGSHRPGVLPRLAVLVATAVTLVAVVVPWHARGALQAREAAQAYVGRLLGAQWPGLYDGELAATAATAALQRQPGHLDRLAVTPSVALRALRTSARYAELDPEAQLDRAELLALTGNTRRGVTLADGVIRDYGRRQPQLYRSYAQVLTMAGQQRRAVQVLRSQLAANKSRYQAQPLLAYELVAALESVDPKQVDERCSTRVVGSSRLAADVPGILGCVRG